MPPRSGPRARLRDDVDEEPAGAVILGSERVAGDVNRLDLRLRGQSRALETVDAQHGVAAGNLLQLPRHLSWDRRTARQPARV
jgi:hypothetical protein